MRSLVPVLFAVAVAFGSPPATAGEPSASDWHRLVGILQYLEADYPAAAAAGSDFERREQNAFIDEAVESARSLGARGEPFIAKLEDVRVRIREAKDPDGVSRDCAKLIEDLVAAGGLARAPRHTPDLERGGSLYSQMCVACNAADGSGKGPAAVALNPK